GRLSGRGGWAVVRSHARPTQRRQVVTGKSAEQAAELREPLRARRGMNCGPCELWFGETAGVRQVTLGNGTVRAEILLDKGANVRQFWHVPTGARMLAETHDWAERLAEFHQNGQRGSCYSDCYEGGWQDVLPARAQWEGGAIGDGAGVGEAAIIPWEVKRVVSTPAAAHVICRARLPQCELDVVKRFGVRRQSATLRVETTVKNTSGRSVRLSWTQHPALGGDLLDDAARVWLPGGEPRVRRRNPGHQDNGEDGHSSHSSCTEAALGWRSADALLPTCSADAFMTFADVERADAALLSDARGVGVRLRWDALTFPHAWLWCARRDSICCIAVEPSTTYLPETGPRPEPEILHLLRPGDSIRTWVELSSFTWESRVADHAPASGPSLFGSGWS
ncbi:MAG TPA: DUF4432 family protein, partial [Tepidisphaeraceae bacterium]|nr:DUF4432 family protein [Tepidisphaeraceae bacterium]